jgi:phosphatidate cytidylyltransferase
MAIDDFDDFDEIDFTPESEKRKREQPTEVEQEVQPPPAPEAPAEPGEEPAVDELLERPDLSRFEARPRPEATPAAAPAQEGEAGAEQAPRRLNLSFLKNETFRRTLFAVPAVVFAIVIVSIGGVLFAASMAIMAVLGMREFLAMTEDSRPLPLAAYLTVVGMVVAAYAGDSFNVLMALACGFPLCFIAAAIRGNHRDVTFSLAITILGFTWLGLGFSHAVLIEELPRHGHALLIDILVATFIGDTCAYGAGRLFGHRIFGERKLAPSISPNKTYEGLIGGLIGGTMAFWFAGLYQDWLPGIDALLMGLAIAAIAPIGDLFASMIKRDWDVKDTGRLFGPHGGLLDRLDAALFTIVLGYYLAVAFVY